MHVLFLVSVTYALATIEVMTVDRGTRIPSKAHREFT